MDNSIYENSDSDKDVDLSLNCSVDQSFRLNNTLLEKKDSNNENGEKITKQPSDNPIKMENFSASPIPVLNQKIDSLHNSHNSNFSLSMNKNASAAEKPVNKPVGGAYGAVVRPASQVKPPAFGYNINTNNSTSKENIANSSVLSSFSNNAKTLQKIQNLGPSLENKSIQNKKEISANFSIDNYEAESNLDLSLGESFGSNFNTKEINIPNSSLTSNIMITTPKIAHSQPKTESDLDKILNTNINNLNALNNINNNCNDVNIDNNNNNPNSTNKNINLNSIQQNMTNNNNFSQSSPSDFGNFSNKNLLETIKEHHLENEAEDALAESLDRKVNKYNLSMNENDIRSKSITNPSFFMNRNEKLFDPSVEKTNPNRIEILVKNNKHETSLDPVYNRLSVMATPSMKIDEILAKNNYNNLNINTTAYGNYGPPVKTIAPNDIPTSAYAGKEIKTGDNSFYKPSAYSYSNDMISEPPKKPTFQNTIPNTIPNSDANIGSSSAATGSSIDDILKKYGIKIDENTAEVLPLNNNSNNLSISKKEEEPKNEIKTINNNNDIDANNSNKNLNSDLDSIRKSIVKLKETDLAILQKELIAKEETLTNKKNENFLDELKKEEGSNTLNTLNLDNSNNNNNKIESPSKENKLDNIQKSDSFSSKVQKILESGDKKPEIANNYFNAYIDYSAADNQRRNTSFQLQSDSNKSVMFNINNPQVSNDNTNVNSNNNDIEKAGTRKSLYQPPSSIYLNDNFGDEKNQIEDSEDMESRNKEKVKRNSGIFMKRAKIQTQEKEEPKTNSDIIIPEVNRKSTYQEKLISKYINDLNEEDEEISRIRRNTNITSQNKYNLSTISLNANTSKEINSNSDNLLINNNLDNNNNDKKDFEEFENNKSRNSTDIRINKKNLNLNLNDVNEMENEVLPPDTAKGKRVSGFMKRPNTKDLKIEDNSNEGNDKDIDADTNQAKDNFMKKLNANILKRGNYKDNEDSESNDDQRSKNKLYKKNSEERSEEADSNPSEMEEIEEEEVEYEEHEEDEENEYDEIKELDEEYESEEISDEAESNENKKAETDALDDIYLNHILKFTEKEIKKNKELTEDNSRKNSAITIFNLINTKLLLLKNRIFYKIKNFTRYKAKNYNIALINCFRIKRNILKETIRKYFNMFLFTTKKMKIQEEIGIVDKFKSVVMEMDAKEYNLNKFLELDNDKLALLIKSIMSGNLGIVNSCNKESDSKQAEEMKGKNIPNIPAIPSVKGVPTNAPKPPSNLPNAVPSVPSLSVPKPPTNAPPIPTGVPKPPTNLPNNIPSVPVNVPKPPVNLANNVPQVPTNIPKPPSTVPQVPVNVPKPPSNLTNNLPPVPTNIPKPPSTAPQVPVNVPKPPVNLANNVPQVPTSIPKPPSTVPQAPVNVPKPPLNLANNLPPVPTNVPKPPSTAPQVPLNVPKPPSNLANNPVNIPKPPGSLPSVPAGNIPMIPGAIKPGAPPVPGSKPSIPGAPSVPNAPGVPQMPGIAKPGAPPLVPGGMPKPAMPAAIGAPQAPGGPVKVTNVPQAPKPPPELQPKRVNWNLIPKIKTKNTLWEKPLPTFNVDYSIITKYFCEPKKKKGGGGAAADASQAPESEEKKGKTEVIRLLDDKKSMNLGIALNKFRLTPDDIKSILENLDDEKISLDEIQKIIDLSPTEEEVEKLKEYTGDLSLISLGERYCHLLANFNRSKLILEAMKFKKKISIDKKDIIYKYNLIREGLLSVKESKNFENLLKFILYVGNYLNSDMAKGNAAGINLGILDIVEDMKSNVQEKYSLLEVIVLNIRTKEQSLLSFYKDFNDFEQSLQLDLNEVEAQIKEIEKNLKYIKENRESLEKIGEKMGDPKLKKLTSFLNSIELNSCGAIGEIISAQDNFKKEIKTVVQYFGEDEKNFKPIEFLKTISEFVKNFKKACMRFSTEEAKLLKKKIMEEKKKNPSGQKSEISKEIQKIRKTVVRKTENRKTNIRKTANKPSDEKHKEEKTESNSTNNTNQPAENTNRKSNNIRIVSIKDNTNSANSKENERKTKARMTKTRITRFIQKTVNIQKDESDDESDEEKDEILFKSSLKK